MKNLKVSFIAFLFIVFLLIITIIYYAWIKPEPETIPDQSDKIKQLQQEKEASEEREKRLRELDDLKDQLIMEKDKRIADLKNQVVESTKKIDSILINDSTKAIKLNRDELDSLGILTDETPNLTNREMGWNAKFLSQFRGLKLQIGTYEDQLTDFRELLSIKDQINNEKDFQLIISDSLITSQKKQTDFFEKKFLKSESFWNDRFIVYGGVGVNYSGTNINPGVQLGIGVRIYTINVQKKEEEK